MARTFVLALLLGAVLLAVGCHYSDYSVAYADKNTAVFVSKRSAPPPPPPPPPPYYGPPPHYH